MCSQERIQELSSGYNYYLGLSEQNTRQLIADCGSGDSPTCEAGIRALVEFSASVRQDQLAGIPIGDSAGTFAVQKSIFDYDVILAEHYQAVLDGTMTPEQATEAAIADITSREGAVKGFLDALGVAGGVAAGVPACSSGILTAGCIAAAAAIAASGNHLYADVRQVIHGKEAKTAVVDALVAMGMDPAKAETFEHYVDIGAIVVTLVAGGYAFAVNTMAAGKAAKVLEGLEGEVFGAGVGSSSRTLPSYSTSQLQHEFKHAADFGIFGNWNKANGEAFRIAISDHISDPATLVIQGTYRGQPATFYYNTNTGNVVFAKPDGSFWGGWKLSPPQIKYLTTYGNLQ